MDTKTIVIDSILGGHSQLANFSTKNQFRASLGIDPGQPIDDDDTAYSSVGSGYLRPTALTSVSTTVGAAPLWMKTNPKRQQTYILDALGSMYTIVSTTFGTLSDAGTLTGGIGNGMEYYDNYMYIATGTDITRYGPLNGTPGFVANYWTSTLGKPALTNTTYPTTYLNGIQLPNHVMHRHSDGKLYIADVVGNQGTIHFISTTKTSVEGDTDNNSTANKLQFGYGLWPTAMESYGPYLAVGLIESSIQDKTDPKGKIALWDTTSSSFNQIIWVEFPDPLITALKNVNGSLYVVSGNYKTKGFRVSKYLGGYSFETVFYSETGEPPLAGAVEAIGNRFFFGTHTTVPESDGCLYSIGLQNQISDGVFNIMRSAGGNSSTSVTAVGFLNHGTTSTPFGFYIPAIGWTKGSGNSNNGIDRRMTTSGYTTVSAVWWSQLYKIGQPFRITRVRIPLAQAVASGMSVTPKIYYDDGGFSQTLTVINSTNFPNSERIANIKINNNGSNQGRGENNFWLELKWSGIADPATVSLPITIEFEILPD